MSENKNITDLVERLESFEERCGVRLSALYAQSFGDAYAAINGELHSISGNQLNCEQIDLVVDAYDSEGRIVARSQQEFYSYEFFGFETFSIHLSPVVEFSRIRIYPKKIG